MKIGSKIQVRNDDIELILYHDKELTIEFRTKMGVFFAKYRYDYQYEKYQKGYNISNTGTAWYIEGDELYDYNPNMQGEIMKCTNADLANIYRIATREFGQDDMTLMDVIRGYQERITELKNETAELECTIASLRVDLECTIASLSMELDSVEYE